MNFKNKINIKRAELPFYFVNNDNKHNLIQV